MDEAAMPTRGVGALASANDFQFDSVFVSPSRRLIKGSAGTAHLQPQAMLVFLCLAANEGQVVSRRTLFDRCWGASPVGDDSVNQAIRSIREALGRVSAGDLAIETVPRSGYRLVATSKGARVRTQNYVPALEAAYDCWRLGWPKADVPEIVGLEHFLADQPTHARGWGLLALILRKAAEYANAVDCSGFVSRCEVAAREALNRDPHEPNARVALAGLTPLFGNWATSRAELLEVLNSFPNHAPAVHDMVFLEMATGRPSVSLPLLERLLADDRFAATYYYKAIFQLWTAGRLSESEQFAARAMALWPRHPANWLARYWVLVGTNRAEQALRLVLDEDCRPALPALTFDFLARTAALVAAREAGESNDDEVHAHAAEAVRIASFGPANAVVSLQALCATNAIDQAFEVAYGYYLGKGDAAVPLRWNANDPSITDQYRRVTQLLFIPLADRLRADRRFVALCDEIGLSAYWERTQITPDFMR